MKGDGIHRRFQARAKLPVARYHAPPLGLLMKTVNIRLSYNSHWRFLCVSSGGESAGNVGNVLHNRIPLSELHTVLEDFLLPCM